MFFTNHKRDTKSKSRFVKPVRGQSGNVPTTLDSPPNAVRIDTIAADVGSLPIITLQLNKQTIHCLVDSGAAINLISSDFLDKCLPHWADIVENCAMQVIGVNNDVMGLNKKIKVCLNSNDINFQVTFFISDSLKAQYNAILGSEFLKLYNITLDYKTEAIKYNNHTILWNNVRNAEVNSINLHNFEATGNTIHKNIIEPRSEKFVKIKINGLPATKNLILIQPSTKSLQNNWLVANAIYNYEGDTHLWVKIANVSEKKIHINKNCQIAKIEFVEAVHKSKAEVNSFDVEHEISDFNPCGGKFDLDHLNEIQREQVVGIINKNKDIFADSVKDLTGCNTITHRVYLTDDVPVRSKPYRTPHALRQELKSQIDDLLEADIIAPSDSPYACPVILVKKKNGSYRLVCDYRKLNLKTQPLPFPLPHISDLLDTLNDAKYYTSLDLCSGYWQMNLHPDDRHKTAFCTEYGLFEWQRLPQGLINAAASFQRLVATVLLGLNVNTYIDDIIIGSATFEEHIKKLDLVFNRLKIHNLKINPEKCQIAKNSITYLGFQIKDGAVYPDNRNVKAVEDFSIPKTKKAVRSFIGLCNFYRKFIDHFADIAKPLTELTKLKTPFNWSPEADLAFQKLKQRLTAYPCLLLPDVEQPFILNTDASGFALGAVLSQKDKAGDLHPVAYASRTLKDAETRYSTFERELLGVVWGISNFRHYLYGRTFTLYCDQQAISQVLKVQDSSRVSRWALALQNYNIKYEHTPGKCNVPADVLSRNINVIQQVDIDSAFSNEFIKSSQIQDTKCKNIIDKLATTNEIIINDLTFFLKDELLYCINKKDSYNSNLTKLVIPKTLISYILNLAHDSITSAHPGFKRTLIKTKRNYFWWGQYKHTLNYVKSCVQCVSRRGYKSKHKAPLQRVEIASRPFEKIAMDAVGPLPITSDGNKHIIVISDYFTRWVEAYPIPNLLSETVIPVLEKFIATHGIPEHLTTDRGKSFLSDLIWKVYDKLEIKKHTTTSYHPSADGVVERANGTIINTLKHLVDKTNENWDKLLHFALLAYRTAYHTSIKDTPAHLVYGRDLILPVDLITKPIQRSYADTRDFSEDIQLRLAQSFSIVKQNLIKAAEKQEEYRLKSAKVKNLQVGDLVLLYTPVVKPGASKKLSQFNRGPYRIVQQTTAVNFKIVHTQNPKDEQLVHVDRLTGIPERIIFPALFEEEENNGLQDNGLQDYMPNNQNDIDLGSSQLEEVGNIVEQNSYPVLDLIHDTDTSNIVVNADNPVIPSHVHTGFNLSRTRQSRRPEIVRNYELRPRDRHGFVVR